MRLNRTDFTNRLYGPGPAKGNRVGPAGAWKCLHVWIQPTSTVAKLGFKRHPAFQTISVMIGLLLKLFLAIWTTAILDFLPHILKRERRLRQFFR